MKVLFSRWFAALSHGTALTVLCLLTYRLLDNLRFLRWARRSTAAKPNIYPHVSVLIPARNEVNSIATCLESLTCQNYPHFEIIILDDHSTDGTGVALDSLAAKWPQIKVVHARDELRVGWNGKSYACQRLADHASGEWLLFTDADTQHLPTSIAQGVEQALALDVDLLSVLPYQQTGSWSERWLVSFIMDFLPLVGFSLRGIWRGDEGAIAANGQYILVRAASYRAMGGHRRVISALVDDFALARQMRDNGYRIAFLNGGEMLRCRMYHNVHEVWEGFSKNILLAIEATNTPSHAQAQRQWWLAVPFAWSYANLFIMPYVFLFTPSRWLALLEIGWLAVLRSSVGKSLKRPASEVVTTPLGALGVMALGLGVLYRRYRGQPIVWKGRLYDS